MSGQLNEPGARAGIAIVGMSGRFPGARTLDEFWQNLRDGIEARVEFTDEELAAEGVSLKLRHPRHVRAGFPLADIEMFDAAFFGVNPREADVMDPQHRLFLECAWQALEHGGFDSERFDGVIGVYGGSTWSNYLVNNLFRSAKLLKTVGYRSLIFGSVPDYMVTRVAYRLNLQGPACFVQTACSTSLVAVHMGCQSLNNHECDLVLAGGVSVQAPHRVGYVYEEGGMESPDGRIRAFDGRANGTVFGSGVGVVVLRRLEDALRDGDHIHAVIRGTAVNNDGSVKVGFTAPSVTGQAHVISQALADASLTPDDIDYVEAHGTGTELGDPIEVAALTRAYATATRTRNSCAIGSVKPNIGHLDAAAGVSSLIKTILALRHRQIPPSINFSSLNPKIELDDSPFFINTGLADWKAPVDRPRRAGVSSFGFGGTNAHLILEEPPAVPAAGPSRSHQLLLLSARTRAAVDAQAAKLADALTQDRRMDLADVAFTLQQGRRQFPQRRAIVCESREDGIAALHGDVPAAVVNGQSAGKERRVAFLFPGQGAQYVAMGRGLHDQEPVFRASLDECAAVLEPLLGFDLRTTLYPQAADAAEASARLKRTVVTQAAIFSIELSLARLWMDWGITPSAMAGHSIGEFVAACLAGVMSTADALRLVAARGQLMERMPEGAMLVVPLPEGQLAELLDGRLWLAAANAPSLCVAAGDAQAIEGLERRLADRGIEGRRLHTSHAFHSGLMDGAVDAFTEVVRGVTLRPPTIPYLSNVTGDWVTPELVTDPAYWGRHIRQTVRFTDNVTALLAEKDTVFIEVGPGNTLSSLVRQHASPADNHLVLSSLRHPNESVADEAFLLTALGRLWVAGATIDWSQFSAAERRRRVPLPTYPFERTRHWVDADRPQAAVGRRRAGGVSQRDDVTDWFYVPSWRRMPLDSETTADSATANGAVLVFGDEGPLSRQLTDELRRQGRRVIDVVPGDAFAESDSQFTIRSDSADDFAAVIRAVHRGSSRLGHIVHVWSAAPSADPLGKGFYSLLYLAQAIGTAGIASPLKLDVVTSAVYDVTGGETLIPEHAAATGPVRVIPLEFPNVDCRQIDIDVREPVEGLVALIAAEMATTSDLPTVAYRRGRRWVQTYESMRLPAPPASRVPVLRDGATYLITGGFGGIGLVIAEFLAKTVRCNLVLFGRNGLPDRATWSEHLARGADDTIGRRIRAVQALEAAGAQVFVGDADVADPVRVGAVVNGAIARFGKIDGVIHSAGVAGGGVIQLKTRATADAVFRPKIQGTQVLTDALRGQRLDFMVLCSSLTSVLGGAGQVDYTAANAYLDAFAQWHRQSTGTPTTAINWTAWQEVGMAVETDMPAALKSTMRAQMLSVGVSNREGVDALRRILATGREAQIAVSPFDVQAMLDRMREDVRGDAEAAAPAAAAAGTATAAPARASNRPELSSAYVEPRTDTERRLCAIWQDMLGIAPIGMNDNFFDLGGHSLLAVRVMGRVNEALGSEVPVAKLYEGLTVAFLAQVIDGAASGDTRPATEDADARERRREKARRQKEHQQRRLATPRR